MSRLASLGIRDVQVKFLKQKGTSLARNVWYVWWIFLCRSNLKASRIIQKKQETQLSPRDRA